MSVAGKPVRNISGWWTFARLRKFDGTNLSIYDISRSFTIHDCGSKLFFTPRHVNFYFFSGLCWKLPHLSLCSLFRVRRGYKWIFLFYNEISIIFVFVGKEREEGRYKIHTNFSVVSNALLSYKFSTRSRFKMTREIVRIFLKKYLFKTSTTFFLYHSQL